MWRVLRERLEPLRRRLARLPIHDEDRILILLSIVVSAIIGLLVVAFVSITEHMGKLLMEAGPIKRLLSPLAGSLAAGILLYRFFPDARGSGIPQTRVALLLQHGFIGWKTVFGKFFCSSITLGSGVALGREGPAVHIGAGVASVAARNLGLSEKSVKSLIPVGTAAAVAAAFNTPLAAILFTLEEILADLRAGVVGTVVLGAATSWMVLRLILGDEPLFHVPPYQLVHPVEFVIYAALGLLGGLVSTVFVKFLLWQRALAMRVAPTLKPFTPAIGGLTVGLLALVVPGVLGIGYNLVGNALNGRMAVEMMLILLVLKIVATTSSYASGNSGGIFGPSLFVGAMLGGVVGHVAHTWFPDHTGNPGAYALVGMGVAFAGIVRTPMTSVIMIFELTRDYTIIVPLMIANLCAYLLAQRLQRVPVYEALSHQEGITMPSAVHWPEPLTVEQAMRRTAAEVIAAPLPPQGHYVHPDHPLDMALQRLACSGRDELPVLSRVGGAQIGVLRSQDVWGAYQALAERTDSPVAPARNWLPTLACATMAVVLLVSGLVYWQRSARNRAGEESFQAGERLLAQGRVDEAVLKFRNALAYNPLDTKRRAALGLALADSGHTEEAASYLREAAHADPSNSRTWLGLARIAQLDGHRDEALQLYRTALSKTWSADDETVRRQGQFDYAALLAQTGRNREAVAMLISLAGQHGTEPELGRRAAEAIQKYGTADQAEEAYAALAERFPADDAAWMALADIRFAQGKDALAVDAYMRAASANPQNATAKRHLAIAEESLRLDPARRGLSARERSARWDEILARVVKSVAPCESNSQPAAPNQRASGQDAAGRPMKTAMEIWKNAPAACRTDPVLAHVLGRLSE